MKLGIVGLPNVGKSTLFNAITSAGAESANYPFCTIEPNVGVVAVPDARLTYLSEMSKSKKVTPTAIEFFDIAGLVKGASRGEGLGNKFLSHIREVEAIIHVVRCFEDENVTHVEDGLDPIRDIEIIELELILADMEMISKRVPKLEKICKNDKSMKTELEVCKKILETLEDEKPVRNLEFNENESKIVRTLNLITSKPVIYVSNVAEEYVADATDCDFYKQVKEYATSHGAGAIAVCGQIEAEMSELEGEEKQEFLEDLGMTVSSLDKLIQASYELLGLISFLTTGEDESRAWTIKKGTKAPQAAGKIHSDIERGFIRAEAISYEALRDCGSMHAAKEKGLTRLEGKDYIMKDGDVVLFRFNV